MEIQVEYKNCNLKLLELNLIDAPGEMINWDGGGSILGEDAKFSAQYSPILSLISAKRLHFVLSNWGQQCPSRCFITATFGKFIV